jgi:hypothetical protein
VDKKFREAIHLLSGFEKDFPSRDQTSDPNINGTVTMEAESDKSESPSTILNTLENDLHAKVRFTSISLPLNADEFQPMGKKWPRPARVVRFHLLSFLTDSRPIIVKRGCRAIGAAPSI